LNSGKHHFLLFIFLFDSWNFRGSRLSAFLFLTKMHSFIFPQFFWNGPSSASFCLFSVFSNKQYKFYNKLMRKNVHPVYSAGIQTHDFWNMSLLPLPLDQGSRPENLLLYWSNSRWQISEKSNWSTLKHWLDTTWWVVTSASVLFYRKVVTNEICSFHQVLMQQRPPWTGALV